MRFWILLLLLLTPAAAQMPVAPTPPIAGAPDGDYLPGYNILNSTEVGYRFASIGGNEQQYRSAVNYYNGLRVLGSSLTLNSLDGRGRLFDQLRLTTQGLGNDPYESVNFRVAKNSIYSYDLLWRQNDYYNPGLVSAGANGRRLLDTQYRMQNHDLTLFPRSKIKFFFGATLNGREGPGYSTIVPFAGGADALPLIDYIQRVWREYRVGNEFKVFGVKVNWARGWENFKDDTERDLAVNGIPAVPASAPPDGIATFAGASPYHGTANYWRANLSGDNNLIGVNGRFSYTDGRRAFVIDEAVTGPTPTSPLQNVITRGAGQRPVLNADLTINATPTADFTISNTTSLFNARTQGASTFTQLDVPSQLVTVLFYNYLGIRTIANDTRINYQLTNWLGVSGGFHYSDRRIRSNEQFRFEDFLSALPAEQDNTQKASDIGIRLNPSNPLSVILYAETGSNSRPFTPRADRGYHALNGRVQYRTRTLQLSASAKTRYNVNSVEFSSFSSQSRVYTLDSSWTPTTLFGVDVGYTRNRLYTIGGLAYFSDDQLRGGSSIYLTNLNTLYAGIHASAANLVDFYFGLSRSVDAGDDRATPTGSSIGSTDPVLQRVQTFPLTYISPLARASVRLRGRVRWNIGYQYYGYSQKFTADRDFRAHTGFSSLSLFF